MPKRHFTATAFVVHQGRTALHWHAKLRQWMPPGGHIEAGEEPVAGVLREVLEETGLRVELLPLSPRYGFDAPRQLAAPHTILLEDIDDSGDPHQHIDLIYFARPLPGQSPALPADDSWTWVSEAQLTAREPLPLSNGASAAVRDDVRELALAAIRAAGGE